MYSANFGEDRDIVDESVLKQILSGFGASGGQRRRSSVECAHPVQPVPRCQVNRSLSSVLVLTALACGKGGLALQNGGAPTPRGGGAEPAPTAAEPAATTTAAEAGDNGGLLDGGGDPPTTCVDEGASRPEVTVYDVQQNARLNHAAVLDGIIVALGRGQVPDEVLRIDAGTWHPYDAASTRWLRLETTTTRPSSS